MLLIATAAVAGIVLGSGAGGLAEKPALDGASRVTPGAAKPATASPPQAKAASGAAIAPSAVPPAAPAAAPAALASPPAATPMPLGPVPNPELIAPSATGPLPIIGKNGVEPWRAYARPFHDPANLPRIALAIAGMGLNKAETNEAIQKLPPQVTLCFSPYASNLQSWVAEARAYGHEVMLQLPMQPIGYPANDPGPNALLSSLSAQQNLARLDWLLGRFAGYIGVTDYRGGAFTASAASLMPILKALKGRGLMYLDSRSTANSLAAPLAREIGLPVAANDDLIDRDPSRSGIQTQLMALENTARRNGHAIGFGLPYPVTVETIAAWATTLPGAGLTLAPVSALADTEGAE